METMTAVGILSLLVAAIVSSQVFGLRMYKISETKLSTTAEARSALNRVRSEIWSGKLLYVGNGDAYSFTLAPANSPQRGNALKVCPTENTNNFVYYYVDSNDTCLKRMVSGSKQIEVVADYVTNRLAFQVENYQGNVASNYFKNNRVIRMNLQFYKREYAYGKGSNSLGESYKLETRVARRAID